MKPLLAAIAATGRSRGWRISPAAACRATCRAVLPDGMRARLDLPALAAATGVRMAAREAGQVPTDDMLRTFNCGIGMIVVTASGDAEKVTKALTNTTDVFRRSAPSRRARPSGRRGARCREPPPVMCAMADGAAADQRPRAAARRCASAEQLLAERHAETGAGRSGASFARSSKTRARAANPLLCATARRQARSRVARADVAPVDQARRSSTTPTAKPAEVVLAVGIHGRHLGGFATDEAAAREPAAAAMPRDEVGAAPDVEPSAREVVEEEQRLGALDQDVVDAHRDQVDADGVVTVEREGELQLRADAVGAGHEHRLLKPAP